MISRFFNKSKPIHSVIVSLIVATTFVMVKFRFLTSGLVAIEYLEQLFLIVLSVFSLFVLEFVVGKNNLTKGNSFAILIYALLIVLWPEVLANSNLLIANIFILLALRRLLSLKSKMNIKKKFFDATFWIAMASLFYFWSILFLGLVVLALVYFAQNDVKNWLIPLIVLAMVGVLIMSYNILMHNSWYLESQFDKPQFSLNFSGYNNAMSVMRITLTFTVLMWSSFGYFRTIKNTNGKSKAVLILVGLAALIGLMILIISPLKKGSEFIFLLAPLAIIMANYLESLQDIKFKEVLIWILLLAPLIKLML